MKCWDKRDEARVRRLFRMGRTQAEIAETMGVSPTAIQKKLQRMRLLKKSSTRWTRLETAQLKRLFSQGCSHEEISGILGRPYWAVVHKIERAILNADVDIIKPPRPRKRQCQCGAWFLSTGFHHRFCGPCRSRMREVYEPAVYKDLRSRVSASGGIYE